MNTLIFQNTGGILKLQTYTDAYTRDILSLPLASAQWSVSHLRHFTNQTPPALMPKRRHPNLIIKAQKFRAGHFGRCRYYLCSRQYVLPVRVLIILHHRSVAGFFLYLLCRISVSFVFSCADRDFTQTRKGLCQGILPQVQRHLRYGSQ